MRWLIPYHADCFFTDSSWKRSVRMTCGSEFYSIHSSELSGFIHFQLPNACVWGARNSASQWRWNRQFRKRWCRLTVTNLGLEPTCLVPNPGLSSTYCLANLQGLAFSSLLLKGGNLKYRLGLWWEQNELIHIRNLEEYPSSIGPS